MNRSDFSSYLDGWATFYLVDDDISSINFNSKRNVTSIDEMKKLVILAYDEMSKRQEDILFAEGKQHSLSLKIKTMIYKSVNEMCKVVINNTLYDIFAIDTDKDKNCMYIYLEEVREIVK